MSRQSIESPGIFGPIGLSMSGGGYRAAAFHLGTLDYLEHTGLISQLKMLSTVSGGTFIGAKYSLCLANKTSFEDYFCDFYNALKDTNLVKLALEELAEGTTECPSGRKDLIIAVSQVYDKIFLKTHDGMSALFGTILNAQIPLQEIIFNTTEFRFGLDFRFQLSANPHALIGNRRISIPRKEAENIRLCDVVAASSCFPGGLEPIAFPDDFVWPEGKVPEAIRDRIGKPLALMDGGIYDNQGIESLLLADGRNPTDLDVFIISDTAQEENDIYPFPTDKSRDGLTLGNINLIALVIYGLCAISVFAIAYQAWDKFQSGSFRFFWDFFLYLIPLILAGATAGEIWWLRSTIYNKILPKIPKIGEAAWKDFKKLTLGQVIDMINMRAGSLFAMANSVFMNRIRSLIYRIVYTDKQYDKKRVSNLIHHLKSNEPFSDLLNKLPEIHKPSVRLRCVADIAADMPTALWFDNDYQLPCLVACGQMTLCYNLMKYMVRAYGDNSATYKDDVQLIWNRLINDWNSMVEDPYALLKKRYSNTSFPLSPCS
jgi:predicted acylesterase/phospholipase RssA